MVHEQTPSVSLYHEKIFVNTVKLEIIEVEYTIVANAAIQ